MKTCVFHSMVVGLLMLTGCQSPQLNSALSKKSGFGDDKVPEVTGKNESSNPSDKGVRTADQVGAVRFSGGNSADLNSGVELMQRNAGNTRRTDSKWVNDNLTHGNSEFEQRRLDQAKTYYRMVLEEQPDHPTAHHRLAVIADMQENFRVAEYHYQTALKGNPTDATVLSDLGWSYILQRKYNDAETVLAEALAFDRTHRKALDRLGYLYGQRGEYDRALEMFRRASTEADAQVKIARLFPNGRPPAGHMAAQSSPSSVGNQNFGAPPANQGVSGSWPHAASNTFGPPLGPRDNPGHIQGTPDAIDRGLQQRMEQRRTDGFAARNQQIDDGSALQAPYAAFPGNASPRDNSTDTSLITPTRIGPANINPPNAMPPFQNGTETGPGNFGPAANSTGATPGRQSTNPYNQSAWPGRQDVQPTAFERSDSTIQPWPFAPKDNHLQSSQQSLRPSQHGLAPPGVVPANPSSRLLPADERSADSWREAAYLGMNAGPNGMFPIVTGRESPPPIRGATQPETGPRVNGSQSPAPANVTSPWPAGPAPTITPGPIGARGTASAGLNAAGAGPGGSQTHDPQPTRNDATLYGTPKGLEPDTRLPVGGDTQATLPVRPYNPQQYSQPQQYNPPQQNQSQYSQPQQPYQPRDDARQYGHQYHQQW